MAQSQPVPSETRVIGDREYVLLNCTKDKPLDLTIPRNENELWNHVDAELTPPDYDGEILTFACPHCGDVFTVDCR